MSKGTEEKLTYADWGYIPATYLTQDEIDKVKKMVDRLNYTELEEEKMNLQFDKMKRFYYDFIQTNSIYYMNVDFMIPEFPDACSAFALPYEDDHGNLIGVAVQADMLNPDYPGDGEPECIDAGVKYFVPDHDHKIMVEVRP